MVRHDNWLHATDSPTTQNLEVPSMSMKKNDNYLRSFNMGSSSDHPALWAVPRPDLGFLDSLRAMQVIYLFIYFPHFLQVGFLLQMPLVRGFGQNSSDDNLQITH